MTIIAKNLAGKAAVAFVAAAMVFTLFAPAVRAQSMDLQNMSVDQLRDLIAQLLGGQTGGSYGVTGACPYTWTRDLSQGSTGADVMALQKFLNADAETRVAVSGAGSVGMETQYFGPATAAAVSKFQVKYRSEVLVGLVNPTGYFGPASRAKANALCVGAPTTPTTPDVDEPGEEPGEDTDLQGEADLTKVEISSADDDQIEEGAEGAPVAELTVEFEDGDAEISRIDVSISSTSVDSWDVLETVSLWVDGEMVAEQDAGDKDDYLDEDDGSIRFSGLDIVAMEDEELDIVIGVTLQGAIDSEDLTTFEVSVNSIRFFDADGVATTDDETGDMDTPETVNFTIEEAGYEDEVIARSNSTDPDSATLKVEDDAKSDWYTVFVFDLDTDDSMNDIEINEVGVALTLSLGYNVLVDDAELVIDGTTIDDFTVSSTTGTNPTLTFDVDGDVTIDAGDRVEAELKLRFKSLSSGNEGATVQASIDGTTVDAEGADDVTGEGAATGEQHTLRTTGIDVELDSADSAVTTSDGALNDYATYTIVLDVTAFDQEVFIPISSASTSWSLVDGSGNTLTVPTGSTTVVISSTADEGGAGDAFYEINEGQTETVTIKVTYTPSIANRTARLVLNSLRFDETGTVTGTDDKTWNALPASTYRTDVETIVN